MSLPQNEEDDDFTQSEFTFSSTATGTLFVVDCSTEMTTPAGPDSEVSGVVLAFEAIKSTYEQRLIGGSHDFLGVVMCGTSGGKSGAYTGIKILLPLDSPDKTCLQTVEAELAKFKSGGGGESEVYSAYEMLWTCNSMFTSCAKKLGAREVILITNVSEPPLVRSDPKVRSMAVTKSRDMSEIGILISLITTPSTTPFNMEAFYSAILPDDHCQVDPTGDIEDFCERVKRSQSRVRTSGSMPLFIGPKKIGVTCAALYGKTQNKGINMCSSSNQPVTITSTLVRESDRQVLLPHEVYRSVKMGSGGPPVLLSPEDIANMATIEEKGIRILSFDPADSLKPHHLGGKSVFIRPSEAVFQGSTKLFTALLDRMLARGLIARCKCVTRAGASGYLGALVPQAEERDADGQQIRPEGFNLLRLPYKNSIRKIDYEGNNMPNKAQIEAAKALAMKLRAKWVPDRMENPTVAQFNMALEAIAMDRTQMETPEDQTQPNVEVMKKRAGTEMNKFRESVYSNDYKIPEACKKVDYKPIIRKVQEAARAGTLSKMTVADLRLYCKGAKVPDVSSTAKKAELLAAVSKAIG